MAVTTADGNNCPLIDSDCHYNWWQQLSTYWQWLSLQLMAATVHLLTVTVTAAVSHCPLIDSDCHFSCQQLFTYWQWLSLQLMAATVHLLTVTVTTADVSNCSLIDSDCHCSWWQQLSTYWQWLSLQLMSATVHLLTVTVTAADVSNCPLIDTRRWTIFKRMSIFKPWTLVRNLLNDCNWRTKVSHVTAALVQYVPVFDCTLLWPM